jgi:manganese transport protein
VTAASPLPALEPGGWRASIAPATGAPLLRRLFVFLGPGYLVATGYMDPGNWATALAGGSKYGTRLLFVAVLASLMAMVLQSLAARLGLASGRDLAQLCRARYPKAAALALWGVAELGIAATDLAEVVGTAIGLQLLFGLPLAVGVIVTLLDTFLVLAFERWGFRKIELFVVAVLGGIGLCFVAQLAMAHVDARDVARGLLPTAQIFEDRQMLYLALGILGATVMPHNLYLHSAIVLTRGVGASEAEKREAVRFASIDSAVALLYALLINGAILVLAASVFYARGETQVAELGEAHRLITPLLGEPVAASLFAVSLIACGLNSTVTATMAGQIVMEGFLRLRISPTRRRLLSRLVAIVPAVAVTLIAGEAATSRLLVASQVLLSFALPFAMIPLCHLAASRDVAGALAAPRWLTALAVSIAALIVGLNAMLIVDAL